MPRVKRGTHHVKHRRNILRAAKGFKWGRKSKIKLAKTAVTKAGVYAYRDRRNKKREIKKTWQIKINAASRENSISYSKLMGALRKKSIELDKKILANLAEHHPAVFAKVAEEAK